jgi:hypothetical protein
MKEDPTTNLHLINAEGLSEEFQAMVVADILALISTRYLSMELIPVCEDKLVIKLSMSLKRPVLTIAINIKGVDLSFGTQVRDLAGKYKKTDPKAPGILLEEIRTSEDLA